MPRVNVTAGVGRCDIRHAEKQRYGGGARLCISAGNISPTIVLVPALAINLIESTVMAPNNVFILTDSNAAKARLWQ